MVLGVIG